MNQIVLVGLSYRTSPIEVREKFAFTVESLVLGLNSLGKREFVEECLIISTCNRVEVYASTENAEQCLDEIHSFLSEFHKVPLESFSDHMYKLVGSNAVKHLFRVSSSIDSMVMGEPQILGQVKDAYQVAHQNGSTGLILNRLFTSALFVAKKVRSETKIGSNAVSISYVAVELAKRIFDDLYKRKVMLVGTGEMAELSAKHFINAGINNLYITSRNYQNALDLCNELQGQPIKLEEVCYYLKEVDIVVTATGSSEFIIKPHHVKEALKLRNNEPIFMIDIAVPRDIDPRVEELSDIYLYDIDDLKGILDENLKSRKEKALAAEKIIQKVEHNFSKWLGSLKVVPTIIGIRKHLEEIKNLELSKAIGKLESLSEEDKRVIEQLASGIIGKVLHKPITILKNESLKADSINFINAVNMLFGISEEFRFLDKDDEADIEDWYKG